MKTIDVITKLRNDLREYQRQLASLHDQYPSDFSMRAEREDWLPGDENYVFIWGEARHLFGKIREIERILYMLENEYLG